MRAVWLPLLLAAGTAPAQSVSGFAIAHTEGAVYLNGKPLPEGDAPIAISANDIVHTESGRAEIRLAGDTVFLGERAAARFAPSLPDNLNRIEVFSGPAVIVTGAAGSQLECEDPVRLSGTGFFHVDRQPLGRGEGECQFKVYQGTALVQMVTVTARLSAGQRMAIDHRCGDMIPWFPFDVRETDALDQWSLQRMAAR